MKFTSTDKAPAALGPYSQAVSVNGLLFTSGQIALDPATGEIVGSDVQAQAEQVCKNLAAVLEANGLTFTDAVKTTCFLADMGDFAAFNEVYGKYFTGKPARSCVAVKTLPKNVLCEVEVIAEYYGLKKKVSTTTTDSTKKVNYVVNNITSNVAIIILRIDKFQT